MTWSAKSFLKKCRAWFALRPAAQPTPTQTSADRVRAALERRARTSRPALIETE